MKLTLIGLLLLGVVACAPTPPKPTALGMALWGTHKAQLEQIERFQLKGRIGIQTEDDSWTANVFWQQHPVAYQVRFTAPMGQGGMLLEGTPAGVILRTSENKTYTAADPDSLMSEVLKLPLPVSYLYYWIRGVPVPMVEIEDQLPDENGYLYSLKQAGWSIQFDRYQAVQNLQLPGRLFLNHEQLDVRVVVSQWDIDEVPVPDNVLQVQRMPAEAPAVFIAQQ